MFSIITPTYNRKHLIHRVYESLMQQSFKDFIWIVVDDGSTDNTKTLIERWANTTYDFKIEYYHLPKNVGKPEAVNFGLTKCNQEYTIIADSDDTFASNTLSDLKEMWEKANLKSNNIAAIWTLVTDQNDNIKGDKFPEDWWQVNFKTRVLEQKEQLQGDKWHCWKTDILKKHPLYSAEKCHIGESHTWNRINKKYDFVCVNIAHLKAHVTNDSLITSKKARKTEARAAYYSTYYCLKDVAVKDIAFYKYYRSLAFEYAKSKMFYSDDKLKLSVSKYIASLVIFLIQIPKRALKKLL